MKRPLLNAAVMFALGEVICIMPNKTMPTGMLFCVSVFILAIALLIRKHFEAAAVLAMGIVGFAVMYVQLVRPIHVCLLADDTVDVHYDTENVWAKVRVQGIIKSVEEGSGGYNIVIEVNTTEIKKSYCGFQGSVRDTYKVIIFGYDSDVRAGTGITAEGLLTLPQRSSNPGGFDFLSYYNSKGILFVFDVEHMLFDKGSHNVFLDLVSTVKEWGIGQLGKICDEKTASIYEGIIFGNRKAVDAGSKRLYQVSGIAHILAVSGLHISVVSGLIYFILRGLLAPFWLTSLLSVLGAVFYGAMTGFGMASIRAVIMLVIASFGERLGKSYDMLTGIGAAVFLMLIYNPTSIKDQSLLLSVCAVAGVCLGIKVMRLIMKRKRIKRYLKRHRWIRRLAEGLIMSCSVNIVTFPIIAYMYYEIPLYSFLLNIFVVPLMALVVYAGFLGVIVSAASVFAGQLVIAPGIFLLNMFERFAAMILGLPFSVINTGKPSIWFLIFYYVVLIFVLMLSDNKICEAFYVRLRARLNRRTWRKLRVVLSLGLCTLFLAVSICARIFISREMLVFLDVGQGDGIIVSTPGGTVVVIDGGSTSESAESLAEYTLKPALKSLGMADVDFWVVTHGDTDHVSGLMHILENYEISNISIDCILMTEYGKNDETLEEIKMLAEENGIDVVYLSAGDKIEDKSAALVCCHPDKDYAADDTNDTSLALGYVSPDISCLFTGDMSAASLDYMFTKNGALLQGEYLYLKVPHHGSKNSVYEPLYDLMKGRTAIVSCGKNNSYGHPHNEVVDKLNQYGCSIYRTDESGAVCIYVKNGRVECREYKK
ncbi:MAG: DNA internalization-related competence protein ComEC/Rec2 [Clostridium sp.]|nr:DNA internalization-related competence protein ComEC/Rec2 [Clostridium sp.]MCM1172943.1 DNA internalization-related competence protein ComEC/Rec2 [Clostridium sp.]MCM1208930.1 DNA internalization-related competence protein ComEC/Rec2 [Ruminococcus sp.]